MFRIVHPPRSELTRLRTPLTPGEQRVFEFFDKHLAPGWEIYLQPHLNGLLCREPEPSAARPA
jgi:hypothetical protein